MRAARGLEADQSTQHQGMASGLCWKPKLDPGKPGYQPGATPLFTSMTVLGSARHAQLPLLGGQFKDGRYWTPQLQWPLEETASASHMQKLSPVPPQPLSLRGVFICSAVFHNSMLP